MKRSSSNKKSRGSSRKEANNPKIDAKSIKGKRAVFIMDGADKEELNKLNEAKENFIKSGGLVIPKAKKGGKILLLIYLASQKE